MSSLKALEALEALDLINQDHIAALRRQIAELKRDHYRIVSAMLTGSKLCIYGKPVEIAVSWPDGAPGTNEEIMQSIRSWLPS